MGDQRLEILVFFKLVDNTDWFTTVRQIGKPTFRALALCQSKSRPRASARNVSFPILLTVQGKYTFINQFDKTKYLSYSRKALHESGQFVVKHALNAAWIQFRSQA